MSPTRHTLTTLALALALATPALALEFPVPAGGDPAVRPQDDLFRHVNGGWLDATEIPGDKRAYGSFWILREKAQEDVRSLLDEAVTSAGDGRESRLIGDYYASLLDLATIESVGLSPLAADFARIDGIKSIDDVATTMGQFLRTGVGGPVEAYVNADSKDPGRNVVYWEQGGLGLPDRDYYLKTGAEAEALRTAYREYLKELNRLAGVADPEAAAAATLAFETALAKLQWTKVDRRDAVKTYNPTPRARWTTEYAAFPWTRFARACGMPDSAGAIIGEPSYVLAFGPLAKKTPLATWKAYMRCRLLDTHAPVLAPVFRTAHHHFKGEKLQGLTEMPPTWRGAVDTTNEALGEAIGVRYVGKHFPPEAKARMQVLVGNLLAAYGAGLSRLTWMSPATREAALDKLSKFGVKIGYPNRWRGYAGLEVKRGHAIANLLRANRYAFDRDMRDAGRPVDRARWFMTPQTVNAYYSPVGNEIVFPAGILHPPFFDARTDDAYNYGAIGAVIGHEISHGFDDQGRKYDGEGRLRDWWTPADATAFTARASQVVAQYGAYEPLPGLHVDGNLTLGENIADLAGVSMALDAYHLSLGGKPSPQLDGLTGDQRFFIGFARVWRSKNRPEWLKTRLMSDPHSPEQYRTNGVVTNLDAFHEAFHLTPSDHLYTDPTHRIHIW